MERWPASWAGLKAAEAPGRRLLDELRPFIAYLIAEGLSTNTVRRHLDNLWAIGERWPVGMPLCRPMGDGLWEIRTDLPTKRTARVLLCLSRQHLVVLHGFIKKTRATPDSDLATARTRQKELER